MTHDIKRVRPNGRYKSGVINPASCRKIFESQRSKPIIYRSSYEYDFICWLERSPKVLRWGSECLGIPYENLGDHTHHTYYPDYVIEMTDPEKGKYVLLVEVKPFKQTQRPDPCLPLDSYAWKEYIRNRSKWKAAQEFAQNNNAQFRIITERTISRLN